MPERDHARFVAQMEQVLDAYEAAPHADIPLICMDESSKELHRHVAPPAPCAPGRPAREDYHYERRGVAALFVFFDPVRGWRRATARDSRTRVDWAEEVRHLLDVDYPDAPTVRLACDNLNTHGIASLYEAFPAAEAHRLARRLELVHTPRNGSWLNVAEIGIGVLTQQGLDRRIGSLAELRAEVAAWEVRRNAEAGVVRWHFTTADARSKLYYLYPHL